MKLIETLKNNKYCYKIRREEWFADFWIKCEAKCQHNNNPFIDVTGGLYIFTYEDLCADDWMIIDDEIEIRKDLAINEIKWLCNSIKKLIPNEFYSFSAEHTLNELILKILEEKGL